MSIEKLDFDKVKNEKLPFTIILNSIIRDIKDARAFMVWAYLYSHSGDWDVIKEHLKNHFKFGDDCIKEIFSYLKRCKLITYFRDRRPDGRLGKNNIRVLNGMEFDKNEPFFAQKTTGVKSTPLDEVNEINASITGVLTTRVENHTCGSRALLNKDNYQRKEDTKKRKSFCATDQKIDNEKKHDFAESMDQMANEEMNLKKHEAIKEEDEQLRYTGLPAHLRPAWEELKGKLCTKKIK